MRLTEAELEVLFHEFDVDLDGTLDEKELRRLLRKLGREASRAEVREIIAAADLNADQRLDYMEFQRLMNSANFLLQHEVPGKTSFLHLNATTETWLKTFIAGGVAGVISRTVVSPLERLKILFQTQAHIPGKPPKYTSMGGALATIYREEGWKGFFKGNATNCIRIFPSTAIQFSAYERYKELAAYYWLPMMGRQELLPWERVIAGGMAGITALLLDSCYFTYPLEFVRARLTVQTSARYSGVIDCMVKVSRQEGPLTLFRGLWPSLIGVIPYTGIDFAVYDVLKRMLPQRPDGSVPVHWTLTAGAVAGTLAQTVAYPLDLVRRRLQVQDMMPDAERYWGMSDAFKRIWQREGVIGFYRGLVPNYAKVIPSISLSFVVYEELKRTFKLSSSKA